jgi:hypothetical protein
MVLMSVPVLSKCVANEWRKVWIEACFLIPANPRADARVLTNFAHGTKAASLALFFDNSEDRAEYALDTYWDIALYENGNQISRAPSPPHWWLHVEKSAQNFLDIS